MYTTLASTEENVSRLDSDVEDLKTKSIQLGSTVNELKESIRFNEENISDLKLENQKLQQDVCELQKQLLYMETYSRRVRRYDRTLHWWPLGKHREIFLSLNP